MTEWTLDRYVIRTAILREIMASRTQLRGRLLDVGCGQMPYRDLLSAPNGHVDDYIGVDLPRSDYGVKPDIVWNGTTFPFADKVFDCAIATEVFEHCPDPASTMTEIRRVLKPGGTLFFTVPYLWPLHEVPYDEYRYTPYALERLLKQSGFGDVQIKSMGGWDAALAQMLGLWARRRKMPYFRRRVMSRILLPIMRILLRTDTRPETFTNNSMMSGLCGFARAAD